MDALLVVVPELDQHPVARPRQPPHDGIVPLLLEGLTGQAAVRLIDHTRRITQPGLEQLPPAGIHRARSIGHIAHLLGHGGIAHQDQRGQRLIALSLKAHDPDAFAHHRKADATRRLGFHARLRDQLRHGTGSPQLL